LNVNIVVREPLIKQNSCLRIFSENATDKYCTSDLRKIQLDLPVNPFVREICFDWWTQMAASYLNVDDHIDATVSE